jgi:co-chaperonin GroES (HSP10)
MTNSEANTIDLDDVTKGVDDFLSGAYVAPEERVLDPELIDKSIVERMPSPTGWRLLVLPYRGKGKSEGGIIIPEAVRDDAQIQTVVGYVFKTGPLAYKDKEKFPSGPWCEEGDWVIFARYAGSRFRIEGGEVRILNDDEILACIDDPDDILSL